MAAIIQSTLNAGTPIQGASREDLQAGDTVGLYSVDPASTYAWSIAYKPFGSLAALPLPTSRNPGTFTVDQPGAYLIALTVDAGLPTESFQTVRLRRASPLGQKFSAAGEYKSDTGSVPVDASFVGWANDINGNLLLLENALTTGSQGAQGPQGNQGDAGPQGNQGNAGLQGNQGNSGPQGPLGAQGNQGNSGPQGNQGDLGSQGSSGPQGNQGDVGAQGFSGPQGNQGNAGPQGNQGDSGAQGNQGDSGPQGNQGNSGPQGNQGDVGAQGSSGPQGNQGDSGPQGNQGDSGPQGNQGDSGAQGNQGNAGAQGNQGDSGPQGNQGDSGPQGNQGDSGPQGNQGDTGAQGNQGDSGAQGNQGDSGPQGNQGNAGPQGNQGDSGPQGSQGDSGPQGNQGDSGPQGNQGDSGSQGNQGYQGDSGPQGNQGDSGAQGNQGNSGAQGNQGDSGPQGNQGDSGPQGNQGDSGPQGNQGDVGAQGNQGDSGAQGNQGDSGPQGNQGDSGPQGSQGDSGPQGNQGIPSPDYAYSVGPIGSGARFTSIQTAINQAVTDGVSATVYIMPGSYTENVTLAQGITLFGNSGVDRGITINGSVTCNIGSVGVSRPQRISALVNLFIDATGGTYAVDFTGSNPQELRITNCYLIGGATGSAGALRMNNTGVDGSGLVSIVLADSVLLQNTGTNTATPFVQSSGNLAIRGRFEVNAATGNTVAIAWSGSAIAYMASPNFFVTGLITASSTGLIALLLATISTGGGAAITQNGSGVMTLGTVGISASAASVTTMIQGAGALLYAPASLSAINYNGVLLAATLNAGVGPLAVRPGFDYGSSGQYLVSQGAGLTPTWTSVSPGAQGFQGAQGSQGFQGVSGAQGNQGDAGPQGNQGDSGPQGNQGNAGAQGNQGDSGPQGNQGYQGDSGPQGNQGDSGPQGNQGDSGPQGNQGDAGPQGNQGDSGPQGNQGDSGPQGAQGNQGNQGDFGAQGNQGDSGPQGNQGDSGSQGNQGDSGPQGNQGDSGSQGNQGDSGPQGNQGDSGAQGNQGVSGPQGDSGPQGNQGDVGPQGNQGDSGPQGNQGDVGPQGNQGDVGPQGNQGDSGSQGNQGNQGDSGPQGDSGAQGNQGNAGPQGNQGDAGPQGNQGSSGPQGNQGDSGPQGNQGDVGAQGDSGAQGYQGDSGPQGYQGDSGAQGNQGNQGDAGAGNSPTAVTQAANGFAVHDLIRFDTLTNLWTKAQANSSTNAEVDAIVVSVTPPDDFEYQIPWVQLSGFQGFQSGVTYFLDPTTAGDYTATAPNTAGQVSKPVLRSLSASDAIFIGMRGSVISASPATTSPKMGKTLVVDSVNGNDGSGAVNGAPFLTVEAAIAYINTNSLTGVTVWILPGTYTLASATTGLTIPANCSLRGLSLQTTRIVMNASNPNNTVTLLTMGENTRVEDLSLTLNSSNTTTDLIGIDLPGTTSVTSKLRTSVLTVDNSGLAVGTTTNVYGVYSDGTGTLSAATFSFNCLKGSTINVKSNGGGDKFGIYQPSAGGGNQLSTRDLNIYVAAPTTATSTGLYVGIYTDNANSQIQTRATSVGGPPYPSTNIKLPSVVVRDSDIALTGTPTIDGVATVAGDRVLLVGQTNAVENGIWIIAAGAWARAGDMAAGSAAFDAYVFANRGTLYTHTGWLCTTVGLVGTAALTIGQVYAGCDILQSSPQASNGTNGIQIGPGSDLVTKTAGTHAFTTYVTPTTEKFCAQAAIPNGTNYLWPGTATPDNTQVFTRFQQKSILQGMFINLRTAPGTGNSLAVTILKSTTGVAGSGVATLMTATISGTNKSATCYTASVDFAQEEYLAVEVVNSNPSSAADLVVEIDLF